MNFCLAWTKSQSPPIAIFGLTQLLLALKHIPKIGVVRCGGAVDRNRPSDQLNGLLGIPSLKRNHPKQVQAVRVARLGGKDLTITMRCLVQPARAMLFECILEQDVMRGGSIWRHGSRFVKE